MKYIIISLLITFAYSSENYIVSDYDYTNQELTFKDVLSIVKSYPNNKMTYSEVETIYRYCVVFSINPIIALSRMQLESDLLWNNSKTKYIWRHSRAMGYGLIHNFRINGLKFYKYGGYDIQVYFAIKLMRKAFDGWTKGKKKEVIDLKKWIECDNAGTHALYVYNPFYGEHNEYNWEYKAIGNKAFETIIPKIKTRTKK